MKTRRHRRRGSKLADEFNAASIRHQQRWRRHPDHLGIDAVHGHSNIVGATLFPHNVGMGATHNTSR